MNDTDKMPASLAVLMRGLSVVGAAAALGACRHTPAPIIEGGDGGDDNVPWWKRLGSSTPGQGGGDDDDDDAGGDTGSSGDDDAGGGGGGGGPGGGGGQCLLEGSLVADGHGQGRPIEAFEVGDAVACFDERAGGIAATVVTGVLKRHLRDHFFVVNEELRITNDHPVLAVNGGALEWVRTEDLVVRDALKTADGLVPVASIERVDEAAQTVYLETAAKNFLVTGTRGRYVVHGKYRSQLTRHATRAA